jgi:hypothetical protein
MVILTLKSSRDDALRFQRGSRLHKALLAKWPSTTRLETRTKESNMCASVWVPNPHA